MNSIPMPPFEKQLTLLATFLCLALPGISRAQAEKVAETVAASEVIKMLDQEKPVHLRGLTLTGNLDFTRLKKKTRGGSYGGRVGRVQEWFSKIKQPILIENCILEGNVITFREERKRLLLKEHFVTFEAPVVFRQCQFKGPAAFERLSFKESLTMKQCSFEGELRFERVHFAQPPVLQGNQFKKGLIDRQTNLASKPGKKKKPPIQRKKTVGIPIVLKNPSSRSIGIAFGEKRWNLSPMGTSTLEAAAGTRIYLLRKGKRDRQLLTVTPEKAGQTFDVTRL